MRITVCRATPGVELVSTNCGSSLTSAAKPGAADRRTTSTFCCGASRSPRQQFRTCAGAASLIAVTFGKSRVPEKPQVRIFEGEAECPSYSTALAHLDEATQSGERNSETSEGGGRAYTNQKAIAFFYTVSRFAWPDQRAQISNWRTDSKRQA